ncbi:MAG: hypothetical protein U0Y96_05770 [Candidatus Kapaibacterium sp.]
MKHSKQPALKASTFVIRTSQRTDQKLQKSLLCQRRKKLFLKNFPTLQKEIKIHRHTARQTQQTMTQKLNIDKAYNDTVDRRPAGNSTYKKLAVQWLNEVQFFNQNFVQVDSFVLRNRQLLIAANR